MPGTPDPPGAPHQARGTAESFGGDAARYDRTRPRYPEQLIDEICAGLRGRRALDVGIGTGVSARPLRARGFDVLGVEVDERMAAVARHDGFTVEVARFEEWDAAGRTFDLVVAGMTWHWIAPAPGAAAAAAVLRGGGRLAAFWNIVRPPAPLAEAFATVYRRVVPDSPLARMPADPLAAYEPILAGTVDAVRATGAFTEPRRLRVDWERAYTRDEWLEQVPTFGGHSRLEPGTLDELLHGIGEAIGDAGFTAGYSAVAVRADRRRAGA